MATKEVRDIIEEEIMKECSATREVRDTIDTIEECSAISSRTSEDLLDQNPKRGAPSSKMKPEFKKTGKRNLKKLKSFFKKHSKMELLQTLEEQGNLSSNKREIESKKASFVKKPKGLMEEQSKMEPWQNLPERNSKILSSNVQSKKTGTQIIKTFKDLFQKQENMGSSNLEQNRGTLPPELREDETVTVSDDKLSSRCLNLSLLIRDKNGHSRRRKTELHSDPRKKDTHEQSMMDSYASEQNRGNPPSELREDVAVIASHEKLRGRCSNLPLLIRDTHVNLERKENSHNDPTRKDKHIAVLEDPSESDSDSDTLATHGTQVARTVDGGASSSSFLTHGTQVSVNIDGGASSSSSARRNVSSSARRNVSSFLNAFWRGGGEESIAILLMLVELISALMNIERKRGPYKLVVMILGIFNVSMVILYWIVKYTSRKQMQQIEEESLWSNTVDVLEAGTAVTSAIFSIVAYLKYRRKSKSTVENSDTEFSFFPTFYCAAKVWIILVRKARRNDPSAGVLIRCGDGDVDPSEVVHSSEGRDIVVCPCCRRREEESLV